jgi:twinkle protein
MGLIKRKLTQDTTKLFGYVIGEHRGTPVQAAPYYDSDGNMVAQKVRFPDKDFTVVGDIKDAMPYGAQLWPRTGRKIVVTEGEIDCMTMSQVQGNKWPTVSIACGADAPEDANGNPLQGTKIRKYFAKHKEYFSGFDEVVLMFDNDPPGREAAPRSPPKYWVVERASLISRSASRTPTRCSSLASRKRWSLRCSRPARISPRASWTWRR